jgi:hypothetical protein
MRAPLITADSPYFYHEDDAHHFNRTVRMVQDRNLNPHYFNKPSLHFYLRMPVVTASIVWLKARGAIKSSRDIRTRDPYGLAGYAFTTSHKTVLEWNRALSVAFSVLTVLLTYLCALRLGFSVSAASFGALIAGVSPEVVKNSHIIGVDVVMALLCVATSYASLVTLQKFSPARLALCGILAGLACSSKYNAAPIVLAPVCLAIAVRGFSPRAVFICGAASIVGFALGSPFIIWEPLEFWRGISYEIWHYGVAGHENHSASPGLEQALFYSKWLATDGVGIGVSLLALGGLVLAMKARSAAMFVTFSFPVAYALLMVLQRANFTRNMVCIVPYVGLAAALMVTRLSARSKLTPIALLALLLAFVTEPLSRSAMFVAARVSYTDSREYLAKWLTNGRGVSSDTAIAGPLQVPIHLFNLPGVDAFNPSKTSPSDLYQSGYDLLVIPTWLETTVSGIEKLPTVATFPGISEVQRVPENPAITVRTLDASLLPESYEGVPQLSLDLSSPEPLNGCGGTSEGHCWLKHRRTLVHIQDNTESILQVTSPWFPQTLIVRSLEGKELTALHFSAAGERRILSLPYPKGTFLFDITTVHSPLAARLGQDPRRLGVSIRVASAPHI